MTAFNHSKKTSMEHFIYTYKTAKKIQPSNKLFSEEKFDQLFSYFLGQKRRRIIMTAHMFFLLGLPLYAIFSYVYYSPWDIVIEKATDPVALAAVSLSFKFALFTAILNTFFGYIITWILVRYDFKGRRWIDAAIDLPFAMPTSVAGLTFTTLFHDDGFLGRLLGNYKIMYTKRAVLLVMIFVSFPFVIRSVQPILEKISSDLEVEENAWCLGSDDSHTFLKVIFPLSIPAVLNGFNLTFCRCLGEFGSVVMVSGNFPFEDLVSSVYISQTLEQYDYVGACVISSLVILGACIFLTVIYSLRYYAFGRKQN
jgi:sulfate/thiosulfate transport system permease protein